MKEGKIICLQNKTNKPNKKFKNQQANVVVAAAPFSRSTHAESTGQKLIRVTGLQNKKWGGEETQANMAAKKLLKGQNK